jgi:hypothetical protein
VESILGATLSSTDPHVKTLINNLCKDELARDILDRVDSGPFVSTCRVPSGDLSDVERPMLCRVQQVALVSRQE